jgi:fucose 4-O-acetylase-like acetyltransferase
VHGVAAGYHKDRLAKTWQRLPKIPVLLGMLAIVVLALITAHFDLQMGMWPTKVQDRALWLRLTDRSINGPIRLVTLLGLFSLMFMAVDRFWVPLEKMLGKLLIPLGQNSLYIYIIHVPLTLVWFMIPGLIQGSTWLVSLAQAIAIGLCWLLVKKEVLFKVIPR